MPGFDRTGPEGQGSRTGRGLGKCNPNKQQAGEQIEDHEYARGNGRRKGRGRAGGFGSRAERGSGRRSGTQNA